MDNLAYTARINRVIALAHLHETGGTRRQRPLTSVTILGDFHGRDVDARELLAV